MKMTDFHRHFDDSIRWRLTLNGIETEDGGIERTGGAPATVRRIWDQYNETINRTARQYEVPCALIIATIATESGGNANAIRIEPGYVSDEKTPHKVSPGLMQTLISTARDALQMSFDRDWLLQPGNSIEAGTAYIAIQSKKTDLDPPLVAAAYNAGKLAHQTGEENRWKLRQYPIGTGKHCDRFVRFFNDAVFMLKQSPNKPRVDLEQLLKAE